MYDKFFAGENVQILKSVNCAHWLSVFTNSTVHTPYCFCNEHKNLNMKKIGASALNLTRTYTLKGHFIRHNTNNIPPPSFLQLLLVLRKKNTQTYLETINWIRYSWYIQSVWKPRPGVYKNILNWKFKNQTCHIWW